MSDEQQNTEKANILISSRIIVSIEKLRLEIEKLKERRAEKTFIENSKEEL
jgi:hypothetical protein